MPATIPQPKIAEFDAITKEDKPMTTATKPAAKKTTAKKEAPKMPAKTTAKPAPVKPVEPKPAPKKGTANMPTKFNAVGLRGAEWTSATLAMQAEAVGIVRAMYGPTPKFMPESLYKQHVAAKNSSEPGKLNQDVEQLVALGIAAHDLGYEDNRFIATGQLKNYPGAKVKPGAFEFLMTFPGRWYYVVNVEDVEWADGKVPEALPEKPKAEPKKTTARKTTTKAKATTTKTTARKTTTKAKAEPKAAPTNALADKLAALKAAGFTPEEIAAVLKAL